MSYLPDDFEGDALDPDDIVEDATPATMLTSSGGAKFVVIGAGPDEYQGCLVRPEGMVEGYYTIPVAEVGLTEGLEPFYSNGWEQK